MFKSWRIISADELLATTNTKKYRIKNLDKLKAELADTKSKLDVECKKPKFSAYCAYFDPFKDERLRVATVGNTTNVSNAWLKCYEIVNHYQLAESIKQTKIFMHFDNAAFPGSFILATHHLVSTLYEPYSGKYIWRASSLLDATEQNKAPLEDKYKLYENNRSKWLMHEKNNGDVLDESNQLDFHKVLDNQVDLYTSDLGFDVSADYNNQESIQLPGNIGQILTGLLTLKKGGCLVTKQYTIFEPANISIMYAAASFFEEFYICKPFTSRAANSETYLVGKGFKGAALDHPYIIAMFDRISKRVSIEVPLFDSKQYPKQYLTSIVKAATVLTETQIEKLTSDIDRTNTALASKTKGIPRGVKEFLESVEPQIATWYQNNPILPIQENKKITTTDTLNQHD